MQKPSYIVYTDGSFRPPNFGAYSVLIFCEGKEHACLTAPVFDATINRMELLAIFMALSHFTEMVTANIYSDSQYAVNCITRWAAHWQRNAWLTVTGEPVKNRDLIEKIYGLTRLHTVKLYWIRGHAGDKNNERCDKLARSITRAMFAREILPPVTAN